MDPHPQIVLQKKDKPPITLLTNIDERIAEFRKAGIDNCVAVTFSYEFSQIPAEEFIIHNLCEKIGMKKILIGYDHMFGKNRDGDANLLSSLGAELGFEVERIEAMQDHEEIISSTKIRNAIKEHQIEKANEMLGYDYVVQGTVVKGDGRGKLLGFPTANIAPPNLYELIPANGIYIISSVIDGQSYFGLASIGTRPTFYDQKISTIEAYFLDLDKDLYGKVLYLHFHKFIREEEKFDGAEELVIQMQKDKEFAINYIKTLK
jgi:riboflavin kinase/FMN adenylyltransferase